MKLIAHRGNTKGPQPNLENHPSYLIDALGKGFDVELDVWWWKDRFYLGHDKPQWELQTLEILKNSKSWCHAKNEMALQILLKEECHCFWHQADDRVLTSLKYIWTYPGKKLIEDKTICVVNEKIVSREEFMILKKNCVAICSDYVDTLKKYEVE